MNTKELSYFITIADKGNLTQAADTLFVSQPTLTKFIQRLEYSLNVQLFEHINKTFILTHAGKQYYEYAQNVLKLSKELQFQFDNINNTTEGQIKIGIAPLLSTVLLPKVLPSYHKQYPGVKVNIVEKNSSVLEQLLNQGSIDIALFTDSELCKDFSHDILSQDHMNIIFPNDKTLKESYSIKELSSYNMIIGNPSQNHFQYIYSLIGNHMREYTINEGNNLIAASLLASNGYGISFLSNFLTEFYANIYHYNYARLESNQPLYLTAYYRKSNLLPPYIMNFINFSKLALQNSKEFERMDK